MLTKEFQLKRANSIAIFRDTSTKAPDNFRVRLMAHIVKTLESEEVALHLRDISFHFIDSNIKRITIQKLVKRGEKFIPVEYKRADKSIILKPDVCFEFYSIRGSALFYRLLRRRLTHELIHYLHHSINKSIDRIANAMGKVRAKYRKQIERFEEVDEMNEALRFLNEFISRCVMEGFAIFFEKLKHGTLVFDSKEFEKYYAEAINSVKILQKQLDKLRKVSKGDLKSSKGFFEFMLLGGGKHAYVIGIHMIYSIVFLHPDLMEREMAVLLNKFNSHFGKLQPRKIVDIYSELMKSRNFEPVLSFDRSGGYINCREVNQIWRSIFK